MKVVIDQKEVDISQEELQEYIYFLEKNKSIISGQKELIKKMENKLSTYIAKIEELNV